MKLYCCQLDIAWEDKAANFEKVGGLLARANPQRGSLVLLPEMFATGFSMNVRALAEDAASGPSAQFLSRQAAELGVYLVGGFATRDGGGDDGRGSRGRNVLAVFGPDGQRVADYTKIHPYSVGEEDRHYVGGERICTFAWAGATVSPFICYDLRFPEVFRLGMRAGGEVLVVIANWPKPRIEHWVTLLRARAIENQAYVAGVNRCGSDPKLTYTGRSIIVDPHGTILADAGSDERVIDAAIDLPALREYRRWFHVLKDARPQFLGTP